MVFANNNDWKQLKLLRTFNYNPIKINQSDILIGILAYSLNINNSFSLHIYCLNMYIKNEV
jgi:hypothetical protein